MINSFLLCVLFVIFPLSVVLVFSWKLIENSFNLNAIINIFFYWVTENSVKKYKEKFKRITEVLGEKFETEINLPTEQHSESQNFYGIDQDGNSLLIEFLMHKDQVADVYFHLVVQNCTYILPSDNAILKTNLPKPRWRVDGLNIEIVEPFRKLRLTFNGLLKNINNNDKIEHVQFNFIFISSCSPYYYPQDVDDNLINEYFLLREKIEKVQNLNSNYQTDQIQLTQFGILNGFVRVKTSEEIILNLPCCRTRYKGIDFRYVFNQMVSIVTVDEVGNIFFICVKNGSHSSEVKHGFAYLTSSDKIFPVTSINLKNFRPDAEFINVDIIVDKKKYELTIAINKNVSHDAISDYKNGYKCNSTIGICDINANQGRAVIKFWCPYEGTANFIPQRKLIEKTADSIPDLLILDINDSESQISELTGGKGCSLALLSSLKSNEFTVPDGFIITVNAYEKYIDENDILQESILLVNDVCCGKIQENLEDVCNRTVNHIKSQQISKSFRDQVIKQLGKYVKEEKFPGWAVRSSAIGEDSEEFSAAGQNESFLGCQSNEQILQSIQACWASLYTYQSVQYRWQHGLSVITSMAVVVQKMVKSECAGVLFTCHPTTCNPSEMVITSNFGLGETVVSGDSDPDTFVLNRTYNNEIQLASKELGNKMKILTMTEDGVKESSTKINSSEQSLTDDQALQLGKMGILLEKAYGNPRDIEWGYYNGQLYLFQSRPITTLTNWTDYELSHEMDYPVLSKYMACTTANVREVIPTAVTALTRTSSLRCLDWAIQKFLMGNFDPNSNKGIITYQHNIFLDIMKAIHLLTNREVEVSSTTVDLALFGHPILDQQLNDMCIKRKGISKSIDKSKQFIWSVINAWKSQKTLSLARQITANLDFDGYSPEDLYEKISLALPEIENVCICHSKVTGTSAFYQLITMNVLLEGKQEITQEHMSDFTLILSSCEDVVSAEVPKYLEEIAAIIKDSSNSDQFRNIDPTDGVSWLKNNCFKAYQLYTEFIDKHGHRGWGEFEVMEDSWSDDPSKIIAIVQANLGVERKKKIKMDIDDIQKNLKSPKSAISRTLVKFFLKKVRVSVGFREQAKSLLVLSIDKLRKAYRRLGKEMVLKGMIPTKELIYHLTHEELGSLIKSRNPLLISKAIRRQKLYGTWKKLKFPEIMYGIPEPEKELEDEIINLQKVCKGTPVHNGIVQARACVIRNLNEISQLKAGDILITYSTDIGWSPYFPMLSGVVTELGGLISHGAVVAREYGLPCIVGMKNVLKYFKTGDTVYLNGDTGELGLVEN